MFVHIFAQKYHNGKHSLYERTWESEFKKKFYSVILRFNLTNDQ